MIYKVTVINPRKETSVIELARPEASGFNIKTIDGISSQKASISLTEGSTSDGAVYDMARVPSRNIVLEIGLGTRIDVEATRQQLYKFFPLKKNITLRFDTDHRNVECSGYVESVEIDTFSQDETAKVSVLCPDPFFYIYGRNEVTTTRFSYIKPLFSFPFSNESTTEKLIELGRNVKLESNTVEYAGEIDVGVLIYIAASGPATGIKLFKLDSDEAISIDTTKIPGGLKAQDTIVISTKSGAKSVLLLRNGVYSNILSSLDRSSDWPRLSPGANTFSFSAETGGENLTISIENYTAYGAI